MLRALALAAVLATGDSTGVPATAPAAAPPDSNAWVDTLATHIANMAMSILDQLSRDSLFAHMSPWAYEIGVAPGGSSGESVGLLRPRDNEPPFLPVGYRRTWAPSVGIRYHARRHALIGLSYTQNSIDYGWDDSFTGGSFSVGKVTVGTLRAEVLVGSDPWDPEHEHFFGYWMGPTIAVARPRGTRLNPNQADSVFVDRISPRTAVSWGLLVRGERALGLGLRAGADVTLWVRNKARLLDLRTTPTADYDGDRVEHWPQLVRFWLAYRW